MKAEFPNGFVLGAQRSRGEVDEPAQDLYLLAEYVLPWVEYPRPDQGLRSGYDALAGEATMVAEPESHEVIHVQVQGGGDAEGRGVEGDDITDSLEEGLADHIPDHWKGSPSETADEVNENEKIAIL
jgi:hypothetical protein